MASAGRAVPIDSAKARTIAARNALISEHLHLVPPIARRVHKHLPPSFDLEDLVSHGNIGLLGAATRYRPRAHAGTPFSAFARPRIRGAIVDSVRRRAWIENNRPPLEDAPEPAAQPTLPFLINAERLMPVRRQAGRPAPTFRSLPEPLARAFRRLPARQRAVLAAFYAEDATTTDVARLVGLSAPQVAREHDAALRTLHSALVGNVSIIHSTPIYFSTEIAARIAA